MEAGGSQIVTYLSSVTEAQITAVVDDICDVLRAHGLGTDTDSDDEVRSLVAVRSFAWPEPEDMIGGHLRDAAMFVIPTV